MPTLKDKTQVLAMQYRDFWNEHPVLGMAVGFVPVVSSLVGVADAVAAHNDERASALEKTLSTAGILPMGSALKAIKGAIGVGGGAGPYLGILAGARTMIPAAHLPCR